jgi:hypothetical protein
MATFHLHSQQSARIDWLAIQQYGTRTALAFFTSTKLDPKISFTPQ